MLAVAIPLLVVWMHVGGPRHHALMAFARPLNLEFHRKDSERLDAYPFAIFDRSRNGRIAYVLSGEILGVPVRIFDFMCQGTGRGFAFKHGTHGPRRISGVIIPLDVDCEHLILTREGLRSSVARAASVRDIQFEHDAFNRGFHVQCPNKAFATALLDARMIDWLTKLGDTWCFEVHGRMLLVYAVAMPANRFPDLVKAALGFRQRIPRVVGNDDWFAAPSWKTSSGSS